MRTPVFSLAAAALALALGTTPAAADDVEQALELALEAYRAGDLDTAKEELDFASQLIAQQKAAALADFLPEALPGWTRREGDGQAGGFGGGMSASAAYMRDGEHVEVQLVANNQMVTAMAGMFANPAMMGTMGELKRINRHKVVINKSGELQALIDDRVLVTIGGNAPQEAKEAYFKEIDLRALEDF